MMYSIEFGEGDMDTSFRRQLCSYVCAGAENFRVVT